MKRKEFLAKGIVALGGVVTLSGLAPVKAKNNNSYEFLKDCEVSPKETKGPFPNKTPSDYVRENIVGDCKGIPLLMTLTILDKNNGCKPLSNALVDIWHCDSQGNYSEYGGYGIQPKNMTKKHFLRGRQSTDVNGQVSFISIFPGYYPGRSPHIHLDILEHEKKSLLVTQIAFPEKVCNMVYNSTNYQGTDYISNTSDMVFRDSLDQNMADSVTGNIKDGYLLLKDIIVNA